jgi:hypothetical protein
MDKLSHLTRKLATRCGVDHAHTNSYAAERAIYAQLRQLKYERDELAQRKAGPRKRHEFSTEAWARLWAAKPAAERIRQRPYLTTAAEGE